MSTEGILFNAPALSSLRRAHLVTLCKRYGLRANRKNTELIARLQEHGRSGAMADIFGHQDDSRPQDDVAGSVVETDDDHDDGGSGGVPESASIPDRLPMAHEFGDGDKESKKCESCILRVG